MYSCTLVRKEKWSNAFQKKSNWIHSPKAFLLTGQRARIGPVQLLPHQTYLDAALPSSEARRLLLGFTVFWMRRNVLLLLDLFPRVGSLVHLGAVHTEVSCLRKDWQKFAAFPVIGEKGGKCYSSSKTNMPFSRGRKSFYGEAVSSYYFIVSFDYMRSNST